MLFFMLLGMRIQYCHDLGFKFICKFKIVLQDLFHGVAPLAQVHDAVAAVPSVTAVRGHAPHPGATPIPAPLRSIAAWRTHTGLGNVRPPIPLDAGAADWQLAAHGMPSQFVAMFCANVIHISPWAVAEGLFAGAARHLAPDGRLFLYGPFKRDGRHTAPSNAAFDESLGSVKLP